MTALILIAHGSKKSSSNNEFLLMVEDIKEKSNYNFTKAAFLEIASPSIELVASNLIEEGVKEINFYPFFLNSGKHVLIDIPNIINDLKIKHESIDFKLLTHFGKSEKIKDLIVKDINTNLESSK
ncbi:MAG: hypothetical protein GY932_12145 [Arcobacter sp.]|nr:hypothetical protein [Arcobacter sp.]